MNFIKKANSSSLGNSVLGMQFRTCEKFWESTDLGLVLSQNFSQIQKPHRNSQNLRAKRSNHHFDCDSQSESTTNQTQNAESSLDSAESQNLFKKNPSLRADSQNLRGKPPIEKIQDLQRGLPRSHTLARNDENRLDSAPSQNLVKNNRARSANPLKSFCYFWLLPKVESPLPLNHNPPSRADSQNLKGGLARRFCESARNDEILDSSLRKCFAQNDKIKEIQNDKNGVRVAESALDSANQNISSLRDSAKQNRGKPPCEKSQNLQSRLPRKSFGFARNDNSFSRFCAPKFDKDDFYFLLVALGSLLSLIYLISGASVSYKEAILLRENSATIAKIANLSLAHFSHIFGLDFSAKLPNLIFHTLNLALIYLISNKILKFKRDSVLCVAVYALIPGVIMQGGIINESIIALFMVLVICYAELTKRLFIYPLCVLAVFLGESALMLFLALCFYFAIKKCVKSALFALICLLANIYIYGIDISGAPRGNFLGVFSELALLYSPALFVYFIYAIYRNFAKGGANLLLYISGISLVTSVILSVRQDVDKEIYMFMSLCGIPLAIKQFLSGLRLRLPSFRNTYKRQFLVIAIILVFEAFLLIFSKQIYKVSNDENLFLNQFYIAKEVAFELKKRNISRVSVEGRMQERLAFYGIKNGGQKLRRVKRGGNVVVEYHGKIIARYAI